MRILLCTAAALLLCAATAVRADEEGFTGEGPVPVRNFQPIQLIFLNLPFERARVPGRGEYKLHVESAESNEIATNQGDVQAALKFETNRTVVGGSVGVGHKLEVGLDVPIISRFGGFLDPFVDSVEDFFHASNPERHLFPNNTFGGFNVQRGNTVLFNGPKQQGRLGDMWVSAKYLAWEPKGLPLIALRAAVKFPTGNVSGVFGSGHADFGVGLATEYPFLGWLVVYGNLDLIYPGGPITPDRLTLNPIVIEEFATEARVARHFSLLLQQEAYTSPMHGTGTPILDGNVVELTAGVNAAYNPFLFQLGAIENVSGVATSADFTLFLRLTYRR